MIAGTPAEYAATCGAAGSAPSDTIAVFGRGYVFGRTGWGLSQPYTDERFFSLLFGGPRVIHGQADGSALTLYGYGRELLVDPGVESYNLDAFRHYFGSQSAHNTLLADGYEGSDADVWKLILSRSTADLYEAVLQLRSSSGLADERRVIFSRRLGYLVVVDRAEAPTLDHLPPSVASRGRDASGD